MLWLVLFLLVGLPVVFEGINKIKRTDLTLATLRRLSTLERVASVLRAIGWFCLFLAALGVPVAGGAPREYLEAAYLLAVVGSAALVVRARIQEVLHERLQPPAGVPDAFDRTQILVRASLAASAAMPDPNRERTEAQLQDLQRRQGGRL